MTIVYIDGVPCRLENADLNKDGSVGGIEAIRQATDSGIVPVQQPTELGESLKELNQDSIDPVTRMSDIDMRSRLHHNEVSSVLALDALVAFGVCPVQCLSFTRQKKRLSVSLEGRGREEIVEVVAGKKQQDIDSAQGGFFNKAKTFFGVGGQKQ